MAAATRDGSSPDLSLVSLPPADQASSLHESRRAIRRQLARWSKTMVQIVGLERVAEELMGRRKWGWAEDIMVGQDWKANSDQVANIPSLASQCTNTPPTTGEGSVWGDGDSVGGSRGSSGSSSPGPGGMERGLVVPQWYVRPPESPDQPLDLRTKPAASPGPSTPSSGSLLPGPTSPPPTTPLALPLPLMSPVPGVPPVPPMPAIPPPIKLQPPLPRHIFKAKPRLSAVGGRRTYTEDELQAALRDIQSGKLGTRRAAVIYGIPRSTLRNKVYKLSQERRDLKEEDGAEAVEGVEVVEGEEEGVEVEEEGVEAEDDGVGKASLESLLRLEGSRAVEAWPYLQQLLAGSPELPRALPELLRLMAEQRLRGARPNGARPSCSAGPDSPDSVILKIPSFKAVPSPPPPPSPPHLLNPRFPAELRPTGQVATTPHRSEAQGVIRNHNNNHIDKSGQQAGNKGQPQSQGGGKGTRPKRGKYRNYDRDSLVEAVRAVQRGEMSVHRAGSYYGVPHSTLEYKVKERHLMRPRKREPKNPSIQEEVKRKEEAEKRVGAGSTPPARAPTTPFPPIPPPPPAPANGLKLPPLWDPAIAYQAPFPFWPAPAFPHLPLDYPRPELYTQVIQRLQQQAAQAGLPDPTPARVLGKTPREVAESLYDGSGENGSFLDGIIRSSLETGLPGKEAGKALLEQLCRGRDHLEEPRDSRPEDSSCSSRQTPSPPRPPSAPSPNSSPPPPSPSPSPPPSS